MTRLIVYLVASLALALGATWLISLPGTVRIDIGNWRLEPGLGLAIFALVVLALVAVLVWAIVRRAIAAPSALRRRNALKRREAGLTVLSDGMLALEAGDAARARALAREARAKLPDNPAAPILEARAELVLGEFDAAREHYRALVADDRTALAALAGLHAQARTQDKSSAALTFAQKANSLAPQLEWASEAVFADMASRRAWDEALTMVAQRPAQTREDRDQKRRRQAVLETALAQDKEMTAPDAALEHAQAALRLVPGLVPAALVLARILIDRGDTRRASSVLRRLWKLTGHPDIALLYAHVRPGASALDRLKRMRALVEAPDASREAAVVLAQAAIEAYEWPSARNALAPFASGAPSQKVCLLMADIEEGQNGDQGKAREWLARAVHAPRDPIWVADGVTSDTWAPISPVTGRLDAFEWRVPVTPQEPPALPSGRGTALAEPGRADDTDRGLPVIDAEPVTDDTVQDAGRG